MNEYSTRIRRHTKRNIPFAVQLYTVRDYMERDVEGTLAKVRVAATGVSRSRVPMGWMTRPSLICFSAPGSNRSACIRAMSR